MAEPWSRVMPGIAADKSLSKTALRVAIALGKYVDEFWFCYPSQDNLAADIGVSRRTVFTGLTELERKGWLTITAARNGKGKFLHNMYSLHNPNNHGNPVLHMEGEKQGQPWEENAASMGTPSFQSHGNPVLPNNCPLELPIIKPPIAENDFLKDLEVDSRPLPESVAEALLLARKKLIGTGQLLAEHMEKHGGLTIEQAWHATKQFQKHEIEVVEAAIFNGGLTEGWQGRIDSVVNDARAYKPKPKPYKGGPNYAKGFQP